jgi:Putative Flp pilus-assembly TadE/G-like
MLVRSRHGERGQTLPFWALSIIMSLSLVFFVYNYANSVRYQIHAQNAADSAAVAALAGDAARLNSVQTLLLALNVQEFKVRDVAAAVPQLLTGGDTNCSGSAGLIGQCLNDLGDAAQNVVAEAQNLQNLTKVLGTFSGQLTGNNLASIPTTVSSLFSTNCVALSTDCAFKYTTSIQLVNGLPVVDEYACEKVPTFESSFIPNAPKLYYAVGHTSYALAPLSQNLNAANGEGGLANSILTQNLNLFPNISASALTGNFAGLNIGTGFYSAVPVTSSAKPTSAKTLC